MNDLSLLPSPPKLTLTPDQQAAFDLMYRFAEKPWEKTFCLHGLAGTGKSTVLSEFALAFPNLLWLCTLTGKAASVLRHKTGLHATTIHSALYELEKITKDERGRREMKWRETHERGVFKDRVVLMDECGQVGEQIVNDMLATGCVIVSAGDPGQLGPVKQPQYFTHADYTFTHIHRQAAESPIIRQSHRVLDGKPYEADGPKFRVQRQAFDADIVGADILLCWTNTRRQDLNHQTRSLRGIWSTVPQPGEPVMCRKNYKPAGIYRGAIYELVEPFVEGDEKITIRLEGEITTVHRVAFEGIHCSIHPDDVNTSFCFGYSCTVHAAAGSEWDSVVLFDEIPKWNEDRNRWLYTGLTRAAVRILAVRR